jgi:histidine triad (HIT) family protein
MTERGEVQEWLNWTVSKTVVAAMSPRVRIPPSPPKRYTGIMQDSIFTKIIKGEIPSHKVYEDEKTYAFLDIHPVQEGMVLVVPKVQVAQFMDLEDEDYIALWHTVKKVAQRLHEVYPTKRRIGVQVEGLDVDHVHVKLFPIDTGHEFRAVVDPDADPDHAALAEVARKLVF